MLLLMFIACLVFSDQSSFELQIDILTRQSLALVTIAVQAKKKGLVPFTDYQ